MGLFDKFKKKANQQKRDYRAKPGKYVPRTKWVRIDNIALAAGRKITDVRDAAIKLGMKIKVIDGRAYVIDLDALQLHRILYR